MITPAEVALGKAVLDTAGRSVDFFFRRSAHRDAGGGRKLEWLREQVEIADTAALVVARTVGRTQANAMLKYFDSAEFESALRHVLAARILYVPSFVTRQARLSRWSGPVSECTHPPPAGP